MSKVSADDADPDQGLKKLRNPCGRVDFERALNRAANVLVAIPTEESARKYLRREQERAADLATMLEKP